MKKIFSTILLLIAGFVLLACKKNNAEAPSPQDQNEGELITTISLIIKENGVLIDTFSFRDPDGIGGIAPTVETITLTAGRAYTCDVLVLDETKNPAVSLNEEIEEEGDAHQFFYYPSSELDVSLSYVDMDDNGVPLGLTTQWTTGNAGNGSITIVLKHQPNIKPTVPGSNGNDAIGETDLEVEFDVNIVE